MLEIYSDFSLADEALDFLLETTRGSLRDNVMIAKKAFMEAYEREIKAGKNIALEAREFSDQGLGSPTALRDMYRDVTGNPRNAHALFDELFEQYNYSKMKTVIDFLLHSLGADFRSKGPSISRSELSKLMEDTRNLQAILGIYRFFKERMNMIISQFGSYHISLPPRVTFELLAKLFLKLLSERYLSPDKILQLARLLGIKEEVAAQIIIFTQMRDAVRQVAPRLYRNQKHKQDALNVIIEALEELEEEYSEGEE